jgi:hypothetical protein
LLVSHVVYGLRVASDLPLPGLAICNDRGRVDLSIQVNERKSFASKFSSFLNDVFYTSPNADGTGGSNLRVGMLDDARYFGFFYSDGARFAIERQGREIWADWPEDYTLEDACTYLVGPVIAFALRLRGTTSLHASSIVVGDRAVALLGQPGAGKSTTAAAFARLGYSVLSDDVAVLDDRGDQFLVQPGYPRVNLWPESVQALFGSADALPKITPTWGKMYLPLDQNGHRFQESPLPLGGIYVLAEREPGLAVPTITAFTASEALMTLVGNSYVSYVLNADMRSREFELLSRVVTSVPVRHVRTVADSSGIFDLCEAIVADAGKMRLQAQKDG